MYEWRAKALMILCAYPGLSDTIKIRFILCSLRVFEGTSSFEGTHFILKQILYIVLTVIYYSFDSTRETLRLCRFILVNTFVQDKHLNTFPHQG